MATKRIKFIKPWNMTPVGAEMELDAPIADLLVKNGRAKEVQTPAPATPVNAAVAARVKKKNKGKIVNADR